MKKVALFKVIGCIFIIGVFLATMFFLNHKVGDLRGEEQITPPVFDSPSYIELKENKPLYIKLKASENVNISSLCFLTVNISGSGNGIITAELFDGFNESSEKRLWSIKIKESDLSVGEWSDIQNPEFSIYSGSEYLLKLTSAGVNPYFIKTQSLAVNKTLPFEEEVYLGKIDDTTLSDTGISLGVTLISDNTLRFGDIFYFSGIIITILAIIAIALIIFGYRGCIDTVKKVPVFDFLKHYGNDIFLIILFITLSVSIYTYGYLEGINISSDSAGYLREAVNMAAGYGFNYDGLAGYDNAWFANWPILYPALIAGIMKITGLEVYLASKILSMLLVGAIIIVLRIVYKKDAWFYSICMTNTGLMYLYWYSWSELPFILFIMLFVLCLTRVLADAENKIKNYICLGLTIVLGFLTRYFGMFMFAVVGFYIVILAIINIRKNGFKLRNIFTGKIISMIVTVFVSGLICLSYLIINKIKNGMPSGVSRSIWWDDYASLTNDLIKSLMIEIFNVFHIDIPVFLERLNYDKKILFVITVSILLAIFIIKRVKMFTKEHVFICTAIIYYGIFIVIRYFSSMDTFYYRFFAPATFLLMLGVMGLLINEIQNKGIYKGIATVLTVLLIVSTMGMTEKIAKTKMPYYEIMQTSWDNDYAEIPTKSVVIFSTLDYRSLYYRSDVIEGVIEPTDTMSSLREKYYGSGYMCVLASDAETMIKSQIYDESVNEALSGALNHNQKYCVVNLK